MDPTGRAGPDRGTTIEATAWLAQVREPGPASVGGGLAPARPALAGSRARGRLRGRSPRPAAGRASTRRPVPFRPQVPAGSGPQPQAPRDVWAPAPAPGPARRPPAPRGLHCPPLTRQARAGHSRSPPWPGPGPLALARSAHRLLPQLPGGRPATQGAGKARAPLRCAYLGSVGSGLRGGYGGGCSARNGASGGAGRRGRRRRRPAPTRRARPASSAPRALPGPRPGPARVRFQPPSLGPTFQAPPHPSRGPQRMLCPRRERERVIACARPGTGRRDGVGPTCSGLCACAGTRLSPPAPAVPAGNLAWLKDSGREAGVFRLAKQWPRSSAPTEDTPGSGSPARPQGWETTPPPPGLDVAGGAGPRPGLGGRSDPQVPHPSPAEPARVVKAGSEPLRAVTALARVMGARGGADTE